MTIDAARAGLRVGEVELPLPIARRAAIAAGFAHRGRQLVDASLAAGPLALNHRGNRLPIVGWTVAAAFLRAPRATALCIGAVTAAGLADDLFAGPERGWRSHLRTGRTTGVLKLVACPARRRVATRSLSRRARGGPGRERRQPARHEAGPRVEGVSARPARAREPGGGGATTVAVLLLPYDLRERGMLGDAGSNALGAVVGLNLVVRAPSWRRWTAVGILAAFNALGDRVSLGSLIERTPVLSAIDRIGRVGA